MNKRIQKLAEQAGYSKDFLAIGLPNNMEKFAELIVRECVSVLDPDGEYSEKFKYSHTPGPNGLRTILSEEHFYEMMAANKLKKHFGVE